MDPTPRGSRRPGTRLLRAASWNVAGLRGLLKRDEGCATLRALVDDEDVDVLLLQETKLQEIHVPAVEAQLLELLGGGGGGGASTWRVSWSCSTARKGYSGVATLWRERVGEAVCAPLAVDPQHEADREGRTLLWECRVGGSGGGSGAAGGGAADGTSLLKLVNVYVPNAGADLQRLEYRTSADGGWDARLRLAVSDAAADGAHVCVGGDMNAVVEDADFHNPTAKHTLTQAGTTPAERASMRLYTAPPLSMSDAFRLLWPRKTGQFTYWSQRARSRPVNRGLRIDYFLLGSSVPAAAVVDAQHLQQLHGSDHAPILVELDLDQL